ncbi:RNA polymerase sigma factor [Sphingobium ummariense]|uniref:RNA polymerase sigma factor n=1 Tax=Sphingobium ummariense TaxID=420994 RepID=UPI0003FF0DF6|nr:sigma-70 family RNA polymerase sigma factor [Sphingobium ummariense]
MDEDNRLKVMEWVAKEVLVHEAPLRSWLKRIVDGSEVEDIVQESYCRIAGLTDVSHIRSGRAYLFTTARMLVLERIRRARIVNIDTALELEKMDVAAEVPSPEQVAAGRLELQRIRRLVDGLPERCRKVFSMRKVEGLSQREVAATLGLSEHTVENDVAKGLKLILKAIADGDQQAEAAFIGMGKHGSA